MSRAADTDAPHARVGGLPLALPEPQAESLAAELHLERSRSADELALVTLIGNRLRLRKPAARALYEHFDRHWHLGVGVALGTVREDDLRLPARDADPFGYHAMRCANRATAATVRHGIRRRRLLRQRWHWLALAALIAFAWWLA